MAAPASLIACSALALIALPGVAAAQDAAETAIILGGSATSQAHGQRALGSAISHSIGGAANAIERPSANSAPPRRRHAQRGGYPAEPLPSGTNPLAGTGAPSYRLENGATLTVSGGLAPSAGTTCLKGCPVTKGP